jgi:hypothetical protein
VHSALNVGSLDCYIDTLVREEFYDTKTQPYLVVWFLGHIDKMKNSRTDPKLTRWLREELSAKPVVLLVQGFPEETLKIRKKLRSKEWRSSEGNYGSTMLTILSEASKANPSAFEAVLKELAPEQPPTKKTRKRKASTASSQTRKRPKNGQGGE